MLGGRSWQTSLCLVLISIIFMVNKNALAQPDSGQIDSKFEDFGAPDWDESEDPSELWRYFGCKKASPNQISVINSGNMKLDLFLRRCAIATSNSPWCEQLTRPNPASVSTFRCTYGPSQPHALIHPDETTWKNAFQAVRLLKELEDQGVRPCLIYNWWRPEPYNANVGGASGRHPFATSVDVRFCSTQDMERAFVRLCKWRKEGKLRAVGYYGSTALHLGVGDKVGNTWGKECPQ